MSRTDQFLAAKQYLRSHPRALLMEDAAIVAEVAMQTGVPERDTAGLDAIKTALKEVQADSGDVAQARMHLREP